MGKKAERSVTMPESADIDASTRGSRAAAPGVFPDTRWTLVLRAAHESRHETDQPALSDFCRAYWRPVYAVARADGLRHEDAQDVTQIFFSSLTTARSLSGVSPENGRLRSFLLASFRRHLSHWRSRATALKRGGADPRRLDMTGADDFYRLIPPDRLSPEVLYDRHWMLAVIDLAVSRLVATEKERGKAPLLNDLMPALTGGGGPPYAEIAARHRLTEAAVKMTVSRYRSRLRDLVRTEIARTVVSDDEIDDEIRHLFASYR